MFSVVTEVCEPTAANGLRDGHSVMLSSGDIRWCSNQKEKTGNRKRPYVNLRGLRSTSSTWSLQMDSDVCLTNSFYLFDFLDSENEPWCELDSETQTAYYFCLFIYYLFMISLKSRLKLTTVIKTGSIHKQSSVLQLPSHSVITAYCVCYEV